MVKVRRLAAGLSFGLALVLGPVPGASGGALAQGAVAPAKAQETPGKQTFRNWTWNKVAGNWKRMKGSVKQRWGKLTHNDIREAQGRRERLNGYIQTRYGIDRDAADRQIDDWLKSLK